MPPAPSSTAWPPACGRARGEMIVMYTINQERLDRLMDAPLYYTTSPINQYTSIGVCSMKTVALLSQKGGSGKATIATHLAVCAMRDGKAVAIFDIDPQASALSWAQRRTSDSPPVVKATPVQLPGLLKNAEAQHADLIIIDTAGRSDIAAAHVIQAADVVLIPCRPSAADLDAIQDTIRLVTHAKSPRAAIAERMTVAPVGL